MIKAGEGRYTVRLTSQKIGDDLLVIITGGEKEHIGSATLKEEKDGSLTVSKKNHKDYIVAEQLIEVIYDTIKKDILVVCGIHIDHATKEEIAIVVQNARKCADIFLKETDG